MPYTHFSENAAAMRPRPAPYVPQVSDIRRDLIARERQAVRLGRLVRFGLLGLVVVIAMAIWVWHGFN